MSTPRRTFLSLLGLGALSATLPPLVEGEMTGPKPIDDKWDLSWTREVARRKYRGVFDVPANIGDPTARAAMWRTQYSQVFGMKETDLAAVVVVRHIGIPQIMNDEFWDEFNIGRTPPRLGTQAATVDTTAKPPAAPPANASKGNPGRKDIETFISKGGIVLACNIAFGMMVSRYKAKAPNDDDARKMAMAHVIKGVIIQPSGPFALMRAQDEGCRYMMAS